MLHGGVAAIMGMAVILPAEEFAWLCQRNMYMMAILFDDTLDNHLGFDNCDQHEIPGSFCKKEFSFPDPLQIDIVFVIVTNVTDHRLTTSG